MRYLFSKKILSYDKRKLLSTLVNSHNNELLKIKHSKFLDLVSNHGDNGSIEYIETNDNRIGHIIINNPRKRNAISGNMMNQLASIIDTIIPKYKTLDQYINNSKLNCIIIRSKGIQSFCSGADLDLVKNIVNTPERGLMMSEFMTDALNRLRQSPLISVACLNGPAIGGGAEIATAADFRIANENSYIQFVHALLGASPGWGGARRLTNIVGRKNAIKIIGKSNRIPTEVGLECGLIDEMIPSPYIAEDTVAGAENASYEEHFTIASINYLQEYIDHKFPGSVRAVKQAIASEEDHLPLDSKQLEQQIFQTRWASKDNKAGLHKE